ncbi:MAG: alpha/beta fold hydrolase, partial [Terracidiphilus sp.]
MNHSAIRSLASKVQPTVFSISVAVTWRAFLLRDRLLGRIGKTPLASTPGILVSRHSIPSHAHCLDAIFVKPSDPARAAILICHGIGEIVDHWLAAQNLLAENGIASLVFDYTGYGKSRGKVSWQRCEEDAVSAFAYLEALVPATPISVLGFSMGSGIATAILPRVPASGLILCSAFTSFRDAACVLGLPRGLLSVLPNIWRNIDSLPCCPVPVLIVHCDRDRAFPVRMASELASACGSNGELVV